MAEAERAIGLCRLAREEWHGGVDGFLRMEGGFEIILCDFAKHLDVVQIVQTEDKAGTGPGQPRDSDGGEAIDSFKAIAARYDGIGGGRVTLNYDQFVSLFAFEDAIFFDEKGRPRIRNTTAVVEPVRAAIKELVLSQDSKSESNTNWQSVVDMIVSRYADRIAYLASGSFDDLQPFHAEIGRALRPFVDYANRSKEGEVARCTAQFLPASSTIVKVTLAATAVHNVTSTLCRTLADAWEVTTLSHGMSMIRNLRSWLGWTEWKKCRECGVREVCFVPIWPMGEEKYFERPECLSNPRDGHGGYWGGFGHPQREHDSGHGGGGH